MERIATIYETLRATNSPLSDHLFIFRRRGLLWVGIFANLRDGAEVRVANWGRPPYNPQIMYLPYRFVRTILFLSALVWAWGGFVSTADAGLALSISSPFTGEEEGFSTTPSSPRIQSTDFDWDCPSTVSDASQVQSSLPCSAVLVSKSMPSCWICPPRACEARFG